jgi:hypothetical protein
METRFSPLLFPDVIASDCTRRDRERSFLFSHYLSNLATMKLSLG